jgi:hypothetical protein
MRNLLVLTGMLFVLANPIAGQSTVSDSFPETDTPADSTAFT